MTLLRFVALTLATLPLPFFGSLPLATPAEATPPSAPILRIETGMHTAPIQRIDVDNAGRFLVTGSYDKTARLWDLASGEPLRVLRPPIGEGNQGKIFAVAISPDGEIVAAGGWTSPNGLNTNIYVFDRHTGRLSRRIVGLSNIVAHLAFSPESARLAATLGGAHGLRIFSVADGKELHRDTEPEALSLWADFDDAGRLVTTSIDGRIRLYDREHRRLGAVEALGGKAPVTAVFSPDGRRIAIGYRESTRVDVLSDDLRWLYSAETEGTNLGLSSVAWSANGSHLFAAGRYRADNKHLIRHWSDAGRGSANNFEGPFSTVMDLRPLPGGGLVFGSAEPAWGRLDANGKSAIRRPSQASSRWVLNRIRVGRRGERIRFAFQESGQRPALFSLPERRLVQEPSVIDRFEDHPLAAPRTAAPGLEVTGWRDTSAPRLNGEPLPLQTHEMSRSLAIAADGASFLLGTEWRLLAFRRDGTALWPEPVSSPGVAWSVNLTSDGRLAIAAFGDSTIRWYRASDGVELLAFFPHTDGKRWVLWTPSGYYDASVDGEDLIGWHVNNGLDQAADFFSAWHFRDTYRRPEVIDWILETLDEQEALRQAGVTMAEASPPSEPQRSPSSPPPPPRPVLPPVVTVLDPADGTVISAPMVKLRINVRSPSGAPVDAIHVAIDGQIIRTRDAEWRPAAKNRTARDFYEEREVPIPKRNCIVEITAEAAGRVSEPARVRLKWRDPPPPLKRRLRLLAAGVSVYADPAYRLGLAAKDARDVAAAFEALEGRLYQRVDSRLLRDEEATQRALLEGLQWLGEGLGPDDVAVLFLAGHGVNDGGYYFLPHDADPANKLLTLLSDSMLRDVLMRLPSQVLLFLDTCRAGSLLGGPLAASEEELRRLVDVRQFVNLMTYTQTGVVVFSAAQSGELSQESPDWGNGAFTKALLEGLAGDADVNGDGGVTTSELEGHLAATVRNLTDGAQTPVVAKPGGVPDLVVARTAKIGPSRQR